MMWTMILIATSLTYPNDDPAGIARLQFDTQEQCEQVLSTLEYTLDLGIFVDEKDWVITGQCDEFERQDNNSNTFQK